MAIYMTTKNMHHTPQKKIIYTIGRRPHRLFLRPVFPVGGWGGEGNVFKACVWLAVGSLA